MIMRFFVTIVVCLVGSASFVFATSVSDTYIAEIQKKQATLSSSEKITYYKNTLAKLELSAIRFRNDSEQLANITPVKTYVAQQFASLQGSSSTKTSTTTSSTTKTSSSSTKKTSTSSKVSSGLSISHVDLEKVRDTWLALHNAERKTKKLTAFTYNTSLEGTATTWSRYIATKGKAVHARKTSDGYYSYASIKEWFIDQGIVFATTEKNRQTLFTENLGRGYYSCSDSDCTDEFIKAIKTTRTFFMSEKARKYKPHYNAIVGNYSQIGLGVSLVGNKYYLVTHYTQDLK